MSKVVSVRLPEALLKDAKKTVKHGHYTSLNELIVSGIRSQIYRFIEPPVAREVRKARDKMWQEYVEKAGGDEDKAFKLMLHDASKSKIHQVLKH